MSEIRRERGHYVQRTVPGPLVEPENADIFQILGAEFLLVQQTEILAFAGKKIKRSRPLRAHQPQPSPHFPSVGTAWLAERLTCCRRFHCPIYP